MNLAAGNPQTCHVSFLVWAQEKEAVPFEPEQVVFLRGLVGPGKVQQSRESIKRMLFALYPLLEDQFFRLILQNLAGCGGGDIAEPEAACGDSRKEPAQIPGLLKA